MKGKGINRRGWRCCSQRSAVVVIPKRMGRDQGPLTKRPPAIRPLRRLTVLYRFQLLLGRGRPVVNERFSWYGARSREGRPTLLVTAPKEKVTEGFSSHFLLLQGVHRDLGSRASFHSGCADNPLRRPRGSRRPCPSRPRAERAFPGLGSSPRAQYIANLPIAPVINLLHDIPRGHAPRSYGGEIPPRVRRAPLSLRRPEPFGAFFCGPGRRIRRGARR